MHILPGTQEDIVFKCPECGHRLGEVLTDAFIDSTEETLQILQQLDEEFREGEFY
jgi:transcription initiation factor IIE alpha subunit